MNVRNLYPCQFEELRDKIRLCTSREDLDAIGANVEAWDAHDCLCYSEARITDELVIKSFDGYDFHCDDFFSTAGDYIKYPDREDVTNNENL